MENPTSPTDAEQTQLTEVPHIGGEPAPPPLPSSVQAQISPTSVLTEDVSEQVTDRPTTTDPVLASPARPRRLSARSSQRPKATRNSKVTRAKATGVRKWKGSTEDCRSVDLIDAIAARLKGGSGGLNQRALNIGVVAFVVVLIFAANWATKRPTSEQTNVVEITESAAEPTPVAETTAPAEAQQEQPAVAGSAPAETPATPETTTEQTPAPAAPESAAPVAAVPVETPAAEVQTATPAAETQAAPTAVAEASATPSPEAQPETASVPAPQQAQVAETTSAKAAPSAPAQETTVAESPSAPEAPAKEEGDAEGNDDSGVEVVKKAEAPKTNVAAKGTSKKTTKVAKVASAPKKKPAPLPAIIAGEPYTAGGPQDLDSDSARLRYQQETKVSAKRGVPAATGQSATTGDQKESGSRQPAPPKQGAEKTLDDLESSYERPLPGSK